MQETRYDGEEVLTDKVDKEKLLAALADKRNKVVALHSPGSLVTHTDGAQYVVQADGSWVRVKAP